MTTLYIPDLLKQAHNQEASDLHIVAGRPPIIRVNGEIRPIDPECPSMSAEDCHEMITGMLNDKRKAIIESEKELDFGLSIEGVGRFRINVHWQKGSLSAAIRLLSESIRTFEELHLPAKVLESLATRPQGLMLVTGPTGSGKSTTLSSIINYINMNFKKHIITVEDPIEFVFPDTGMSLIQQREVYDDTHSFAKALKYILRQDPDVVMVGEMRDLETISSVLTAAETGHLCFSTLHTLDTPSTIDRIIDVFPKEQQEQVRIQLAFVLEGILCQRLMPNAQNTGREIATEIMIATTGIRAQIRESRTHQIPTMIESGAKYGMVTMDRSITELLRQRRITREVAMRNAQKPDMMLKMLE